MGHSRDVTGVEGLVRDGLLDPDEVVAIVGKTEGSGGKHDQTRSDADRSLRRVLLDLGTRSAAEVQRIPMVFSSGGVGLLEPNAVLFTRRPGLDVPGGAARLTIGTAQTPPIPECDLGRLAMVSSVTRSVQAAARAAGIDAAEASYVLAKSCLPAPPPAPPHSRGDDGGYDDMETLLRTSGAAALGVGVAVGDVAMPTRDDEIATNHVLWSERASTSTGHEHPETQVVLFGNRAGAGGSLGIGRAVMEDALDVASLTRAIRDAGVAVPNTHVPDEIRRRVVAVFVKSGTPGPTLRGGRQVQEDRNPHYIAQVKATVGGIFAAALGDPAIYISGAAVHQGPPGGGSVAVIVDHAEEGTRS